MPVWRMAPDAGTGRPGEAESALGRTSEVCGTGRRSALLSRMKKPLS